MNSALAKHLIWKPILLCRGQNIWPLMDRFRDTQYRDLYLLEEARLAAFQQVFSYACNSIPFYQKKYQAAGISPGQIRSWGDVASIPVLTKQEIMQAADFSGVRPGRKFKKSTSGSTGKPMVFYKDHESMTCIDAILYRNYAWFGVGLGDRQARFWGHPLGKWSRFKVRTIDTILNRMRMSAFDLHEKSYQRYLKEMKAFGAQYIYGYAQSIYQFCSHFYHRGIVLSHLKLKTVILTGEMVFPHQVKLIQEVLGCPVTQEYGCTEVGVIAFGCTEGTMHLMENLHVETLPEGGGKNGEIVVSELYGTLFPFIRYQIGDRGRISSRACPCGRKLKVLEELTGRKDDFIICPDGRLVDPYLVEYTINEIPKQYGTIAQFKVVQKDYTSLLIQMKVEGKAALAGEYIRRKVEKILPPSIRVAVDLVDHFPREKSGKLRCFTSMLKTGPNVDASGADTCDTLS